VHAHIATAGGGRKFNPLILSEIQNAGDTYGRHSARTRLRAGSPWHAETGDLHSYVARHTAVCSQLGADRAFHLGAFDLTAGNAQFQASASCRDS
jgi:hypothetical protein